MAPVILLTRPAPDADRFAAQLRARMPDLRIVISPLIRVENCAGLPAMTGVSGVIFTSHNGVRAYVDAGGAPLPCFCVGAQTASLAISQRLPVQAYAPDAKALIDVITKRNPDGLWVHMHGDHLRFDLVDALQQRGINARGHLIYQQLAQPLNMAARSCLTGSDPVVLPIFSPRTGKLLIAENLRNEGAHPTAPTYIVAMSAAVAETLTVWHNMTCVIADAPESASMLDAVAAILRCASRVESDGRAK